MCVFQAAIWAQTQLARSLQRKKQTACVVGCPPCAVRRSPITIKSFVAHATAVTRLYPAHLQQEGRRHVERQIHTEPDLCNKG